MSLHVVTYVHPDEQLWLEHLEVPLEMIASGADFRAKFWHLSGPTGRS